STGYALYHPNGNGDIILRYKLADANDKRDFEFHERLARKRREVESRFADLGAEVEELEGATEYAFRARLHYDGDPKALTDYVEDVPGCEVLSLGRSLEIVKDLGDAQAVSKQYGLGRVRGTHAIGHARLATES